MTELATNLKSRDRRLAGVGGIAFSVALVLGFTLGGPNGGQYGSEHVADFLGRSSTGIIVSTYLLAVSMVGLIALMAYLRKVCFGPDRQDSITWATSLLAGLDWLQQGYRKEPARGEFAFCVQRGE